MHPVNGVINFAQIMHHGPSRAKWIGQLSEQTNKPIKIMPANTDMKS
jgi:hypothetical protein